MPVSTPSSRAASRPAPLAKGFDPDEIRRLVDKAKERGLIKGGPAPDGAVVIHKDGLAGAALGAVRSVWMDVSPETAETWLRNNFRNRSISEDCVTAYARDMLNGLWVPTHQGIGFNADDELIDGQHRLKAIILSGCTIRTMVTFGLPCRIDGAQMTTMDAVDRGRTRSVADQLKIQHAMKNGSIIAAVAMNLAGLCCRSRTRRLSVGQTLDVYAQFKQAADYVIDHRSKERGLKAAGVLAAVAFAATVQPQILDLYHTLVTGDEGFPAGSPIQRLRSFLVGPDAILFTRGTDRGLAELVLFALYQQERNTASELIVDPKGLDYYANQQPDRIANVTRIFNLSR